MLMGYASLIILIKYRKHACRLSTSSGSSSKARIYFYNVNKSEATKSVQTLEH